MRPLVLVFTAIASAALPATLSARRCGEHRATALLVYTTAANIIERPDGVKIA
ncbi:hypothetical protein [Umezawaea sp. NPDC059074]|uniref:hypothetical protein n=1 Tax=Umezawaea sp. NPDC059074 TaxID=3346716 RepID=UPI0036D12ED1